MPIYEYKCSKCGKTFELLQSLSAESIQKCIYCQAQVKKVIHAAAFQFKGSGWYITDYKKKSSDEKKVETQPKQDSKDTKNANIN